MSACQLKNIADKVDEQPPWLNVSSMAGAINGYAYPVVGHRLPFQLVSEPFSTERTAWDGTVNNMYRPLATLLNVAGRHYGHEKRHVGERNILKIGGTYKIAAPRQKVWDALLDADTLAAAIPGAERCMKIAPGKFQVEIKMGIGIIRGRFSGTFETTELNPPSSQRLIMIGEGTGGWIKGEGALTLRDVDGNTEIDVDGEALTGGVLARVGQRMIGNASKTMMGQFFKNLNREATR